MDTRQIDWYFIINPRAGSGKTMSEWIPAEKKLESLGIGYTTAYTDHKRHATALAYQAAADGYRQIAAVGGDGSIHEVFAGIIQWCDENDADPADFKMAVAPIGSGNDWIKSTGVPGCVTDTVYLIGRESFSPMDIMRVRTGNKTRFMANAGGFGLDAHVCRSVNMQKESGRRSSMIYFKALLKAIFHLQPIRIQMIADGKEVFSGNCFTVAFGNGRFSGGGLQQLPLAVMDDGLIDYMIVPCSPIISLLSIIPRLFNGTTHKSAKVIYGRCSRLEVLPLDTRSKDIFELDGEIEGTLPISISVGEERIMVLTGQSGK